MLSQTITVSKDRPAEKIAEDIKRRLLPGYLAAFAKYKERLDAQDKYRAEVEVVAAELAQVMGVKQSTTTLYGPWNSKCRCRAAHRCLLRVPLYAGSGEETPGRD